MKKLLIDSALNNRPIEIIYLAKDGKVTKRMISVRKMNQNKILAFCHTKRQFRTFFIKNILAAQYVRNRFNSLA